MSKSARKLLARVSGGGTAAWMLADRLGTVCTVVDNTGAVLDTITYDGYGNITIETGAANGGQYKFVGYRYDSETGLYCPDPTTARYYGPAVGNWNGRDPWGFGAQDANLYRYIGNNPTNATDPSGLDFIAVAERPVFGTILPNVHRLRNNHMSLEFWTSCKDPRKDQDFHPFTTKDLTDTFGGWLWDSVELLNSTGWKAWIYDPGVFAKDWYENDVSVAAISYYTSRGYFHRPIYVGDDVQQMWEKVLLFARKYPYGEQRAPGYPVYPDASNKDQILAQEPIKHWPQSRYFSVELEATFEGSNNSNSFVRAAALDVFNLTISMLPGAFLPGSQPGAKLPRHVPTTYYDPRGPFRPETPLLKPVAPPGR